jgi:hypothetical protein
MFTLVLWNGVMFDDFNSTSDIIVICLIGIFFIVFTWGGIYIFIYKQLEDLDKSKREYGKKEKNAKK